MSNLGSSHWGYTVYNVGTFIESSMGEIQFANRLFTDQDSKNISEDTQEMPQ